MEESRTKKSARNIFFASAYKIIDLILGFLIRSIFIREIGINYLGLNGLFANIVTVLSLAELGIGSAIAFSLYKPLAEKNNEKIAALLKLYKQFYTFFGFFIIFAGLALMPVLKYIVNLPNDVDNIYLIYFLTILNTAISYFLSYRRTILIADQRTDLVNKIDLIFLIIKSFVLFFVIIFWGNYIVYLVVQVLNVLFSNIALTIIAKKRYKDVELIKNVSLSKEEKKTIIKHVSAGFFSKFGQTVVNSTDNILISIFLGTVLVGVYSNYTMIITALDMLLYLIFSSITASVGNFSVTNSSMDSFRLFKKINFLNFGVVFCTTICLVALTNPFIIIWVGKDYVISDIFVYIITLNFYLTSNQNCISNFISTNGLLYYKNRFRALIEALTNLFFSIVLVRYANLGILGIILGTTICFLAGRVTMDVAVLYKYLFNENVKKYYFIYILRFFLVVIVSVFNKFIINWLLSFVGLSIFSWILSAIISIMISILIFALIYNKNESFKFYISMFKKGLKSMVKNKNEKS